MVSDRWSTSREANAKVETQAVFTCLVLFTDALSHGSSSICKCSDEWSVVRLGSDVSMQFDVSIFFLRQPLNLDSIVRAFIGG